MWETTNDDPNPSNNVFQEISIKKTKQQLRISRKQIEKYLKRRYGDKYGGRIYWLMEFFNNENTTPSLSMFDFADILFNMLIMCQTGHTKEQTS